LNPDDRWSDRRIVKVHPQIAKTPPPSSPCPYSECKGRGTDEFGKPGSAKRHEEAHWTKYRCNNCDTELSRWDAYTRHLRTKGGKQCNVMPSVTIMEMDWDQNIDGTWVPTPGGIVESAYNLSSDRSKWVLVKATTTSNHPDKSDAI